MKKAAEVGLLLLFLMASAVAGLYFSNRSRMMLAQQMMSDSAGLRLGTDVSDVRAFTSKYDGRLSASSQQNQCTDSDCLAVITVPSAKFSPRYSKFLDAYNELLQRYWAYSVFIWVKNGKVVAQQQWLTYATPKRTLAVITETSPGSADLCRVSSYRLHKTFSVNMAPHHFNVWAAPDAQQKYLVSKLDLNCVGTFSGCNGLSEMAPYAWQQYESDQRLLQPESPTRTPEDTDACIGSFKER